MSVIRLIAAILTVIAIAIFVRLIGPDALFRSPMADSTLALGFILIFAYALGQIANITGAPKITGYLIAGIISGPFVLDLVTVNDAKPLQLVNGLALSLIAFTAGGEIKISRFLPRAKSLIKITIGQFSYTFIVVFFIFLPLFYFSQLLADSFSMAVAGALLLAVVATANSPATAVAVITETGARGPVSDTVMGVTVFKDVLVVVAFALIMAISGAIAGGGERVTLYPAFHVLYEITVSIIQGLIIGVFMVTYLRLTDKNAALFVVGAALIVVETCIAMNTSILLVSITAGFFVENYSKEGDALIKGIEAASAPVYVTFFSLAGQGLDLNALLQMWPYTILLVSSRALGVMMGTLNSVKAAGEDERIGKYSWTGFLGQAGVSIGFAIIIANQFPGWGEKLAALALAGVVINQLVGPILMKRSLLDSGEAAVLDEQQD